MASFEMEFINQAIKSVNVCEKCGEGVYEIIHVITPNDPPPPFVRLCGMCQCGHVTICVVGTSDALRKFKRGRL
jgi:hypothetical protein